MRFGAAVTGKEKKQSFFPTAQPLHFFDRNFPFCLEGERSRRERGLLDRRREGSGGLKRGENNARKRKNSQRVSARRAEPDGRRGLRGALVVVLVAVVAVVSLVFVVRLVFVVVGVPTFSIFFERGRDREGEEVEKERTLRIFFFVFFLLRSNPSSFPFSRNESKRRPHLFLLVFLLVFLLTFLLMLVFLLVLVF